MANPGKIREVGVDGITMEAATPASQPGDVFPSGVILQFAGAAAPTNWMICDGTAISRTTYATLFAAIGTTYGSGDGSTTFNLPDLRDKVPVGKSASKALGSTGGSETHTLLISEVPSHNHGGTTVLASTGISIPSGGDHNHDVSLFNNGAGAGIQRIQGSLVGAGSYGIATTNSTGPHSHSVTDPTHNHTILSQGGSGSHSIMQPYLALNHIIKT